MSSYRYWAIGTVVSLLALGVSACSSSGTTSDNTDGGAGDGGHIKDGSTTNDGIVLPDVPRADSSDDCPSGCPTGTTCSRGQCVPDVDCKTDEDCDNDRFCKTGVGCVPWGTDGRTHDDKCLLLSPVGQFAPSIKCEFTSAPPGDPFPKHLDVQATPLVVNFHADPSAGPPSIVGQFTEQFDTGGYDEHRGILRILSGADCSQQHIVGGTDMDGDGIVDWTASSVTPALGDLDGDGVAEIVAYGGDLRLLAFTFKAGAWSVMWVGKQLDGTVFHEAVKSAPSRVDDWGGVSIHDLDDDGVPEVIAQGHVFSAAGKQLATRPADCGKPAAGFTPVLANLDEDPAIEFTNGQFMWQWAEGTWKKETFTGASGPGYVAVANFGAYGSGPEKLPEIVVVRADSVSLFASDGTALPGTPVAMPGAGGGRPTVGDYDGDGLPEVGVAGLDYYTVFDMDCTDQPRPGGKCEMKGKAACDNASGGKDKCGAGVLWSRKTQDHSSRITGSSVFDFEADGKAEVVYADECFVRVYDGQDGNVLFSQYRSSCTWCENPIVADVDGNFRADLVVPSNKACGSGGAGIACQGLLGPGGAADPRGVDPQFDGLRCEKATDCVSGVCEGGLCRCTATSECCAAGDDAACSEMGYKCFEPPASVGGSKTCRAVHPHGVQGIRVYSDVNDKWVRSRTIWNQHAYAVTHVNENGTIPRTSEWRNNWEQEGLNNFRQNVPGERDGKAISDPTVGGTSLTRCVAGTAKLVVQACNRGSDDMGAGVKIGFYVGTDRVCQAETTRPLKVGECEEVSCDWPNAPRGESNKVDVLVRINDGSSLAECKDGNNTGTLKGVFCTSVH